MRTNALGFIEVYGLVAGIEAADAMLKSAHVRLLRQHGVHPCLISLVVEGDLAACRAAVNAGVAAASQIGRVIASHVIGRPDTDTEVLILDLLREPGAQAKHREAGRLPAEASAVVATVPPVPRAEAEAKPVKPAAPPVKPEEKPNPARRAAETKVSPQPRGKLAEALAYIAGSKPGYSWQELKTRFPGLSQQVRKQLDAAVASGELLKTGARYRKPGAKEEP